ncbi:hypothetical protein [Actinomadura atramentaria]|uniref:hypothetical protein n=1 Tax=Actinomadura atramentaria TaxID=1990 RepID=UPI0012F8209D|nr:hypothetical protein [Actinomadura atramentaria]
MDLVMPLVFAPAVLFFLAFVFYAGLAAPLLDITEPLRERRRARLDAPGPDGGRAGNRGAEMSEAGHNVSVQ